MTKKLFITLVITLSLGLILIISPKAIFASHSCDHTNLWGINNGDSNSPGGLVVITQETNGSRINGISWTLSTVDTDGAGPDAASGSITRASDNLHIASRTFSTGEGIDCGPWGSNQSFPGVTVLGNGTTGSIGNGWNIWCKEIGAANDEEFRIHNMASPAGRTGYWTGDLAGWNSAFTANNGSTRWITLTWHDTVVAEPDLFTYELHTTGALVHGNPIYFAGRTKNSISATANAGASVTRYLLDIGNNGSYDLSWDRSIPALAIGENYPTSTSGENWTTTLGTHKIAICADRTNLVSESDESNNCTSITFTVTAPDLITSNLQTHGTLVAGNLIYFSGTTRNQGNSPASSSTTTFLLDVGNDDPFPISEYTWSRPTSTLDPNNSQSLNTSTTSWTAVAGTHQIVICADWGPSVVVESNENNNCSDITFTVLPAPKPSPCPQLGDIDLDGLVSADDANLTVSASLTPSQRQRADVNGDGLVTFTGDGATIFLYLSSTISTFPGCPPPVNLQVVSQTCKDNGKLDVKFGWDPMAGATSYKVEIAENPSFSPLKASNITTSTSHTFTDLKSDTAHWWHVRRETPTASSWGVSSFRTSLCDFEITISPQSTSTDRIRSQPGSTRNFTISVNYKGNWPTTVSLDAHPCDDLNGGNVDGTDLILLISHDNQTPASPGWDPIYDLDQDGKVESFPTNEDDYVLLNSQVGLTCNQISTSWSPPGTSIASPPPSQQSKTLNLDFSPSIIISNRWVVPIVATSGSIKKVKRVYLDIKPTAWFQVVGGDVGSTQNISVSRKPPTGQLNLNQGVAYTQFGISPEFKIGPDDWRVQKGTFRYAPGNKTYQDFYKLTKADTQATDITSGGCQFANPPNSGIFKCNGNMTIQDLGPWFDLAWPYRKKITINGSRVLGGPHGNFPVLIKLSDPDLTSKAQSDADDIVFTDSDKTTKLSHEIEKYTSASGELFAWVKIPSLTNSNQDIFIYYGNSSAANQQNVTAVWDPNYKMVHHFNDLAANLTSLDSTSNAINGTQLFGVSEVQAGSINGAFDFNGGLQFIQLPGGALNLTSNITVSAWVNADVSSLKRIVSHWGDTSAEQQWLLQVEPAGVGVKGEFARQAGGIFKVATGTSSNCLGSCWVYLTGRYDGSNTQIFVNGNLEGAAAGSLSAVSTSHNVRIGHEGDGTGSLYFDGRIDEVRVSNTNRSNDWIKTEFNNQSDPVSFHTIGSQETAFAPNLQKNNFRAQIIKSLKDYFVQVYQLVFKLSPTPTQAQVLPSNATIIFVNGDLTISKTQIIKPQADHPIIFIASGDVKIAPNVERIEAYFIVDKTFYTRWDSVANRGQRIDSDPADITLTIFGGVVASCVGCAGNAISLERDLLTGPQTCPPTPGIGNDSCPAEVFTYDPSLPVILIPDFGEPSYNWKEVAP